VITKPIHLISSYSWNAEAVVECARTTYRLVQNMVLTLCSGAAALEAMEEDAEAVDGGD